MNFLYRITLIMSTLVLLTSLVQFILFDRIFISDIDALLLDINKQAANNVSIQLLENFRKIEMSLKIIATEEKLRENQDILDKVNMTFPEVDVITILNAQGDILFVSGNQYNLMASNFSQREYFQQAIQGKSYISDVFTSARGSKIVSIAVPIVNDNHIDGVVVGFVKLHGASLASMFDNKIFGRNGYISILDRQGDIVYHPDKEQIGRKNLIINELQEQTGSKILQDFSGKENFVGYSKVPELNWIVTVNTSAADLIKNRNIMIYESLFVAIIGIAVIVCGSAYIIRRYTKPLDQLIETFNDLKEGNYRKIDPRDYKKEFHEIVQVYNNTVKKIEHDHHSLEDAAEIDHLTGTYNRRAFENQLRTLKQEIANGTLEKLGAFLLDVDHFKELNDKLGHFAGDAVLKKVTEIVKSIAGEQSIFRFGGDEFVVILQNTSDEALASIAEVIRSECEKSLNGCTVSIGVAKIPKDTHSIEQLIEFADKALYISKKDKNKVTVYMN